MQRNHKPLLSGTLLFLLGFGLGKWGLPAPRERVPGLRFLIVNADDFGASEAITQGVLQAWHAGIVSSTSAQVNLAGAAERIRAAHQACPELPIGLHLSITEGQPVLPAAQVPSLVDSHGDFYSAHAIIAHLPQINHTELRAELYAQAELLLSLGVRFDHIDYHNHMLVLYTPFYPLVIELAQAYAVPVRQPVPESLYAQIKLNGGSGASAAIQELLAFGLRHPRLALQLMPHMTPDALKQQAALLSAHNIPTPNWFVDAFYNNASAASLIAILQQLPPGVSELMVHPGLKDPQEPVSAYAARALELQALTDPQVLEALVASNTRLVDYSFLTRAARTVAAASGRHEPGSGSTYP